MCENGCKCSKADLTVEPTLEVGDTVEVACDMCKGEKTDYSWRQMGDMGPAPACWRCKGVGFCTFTVKEPEMCPGCNESLRAGQIRLDHMSMFGNTHFSSKIGISRFDYTVAYSCPSCSCYWTRFGGERKLISEEAALTAPRNTLMGC